MSLESDKKIVQTQIGREPRGMVGVAAKSTDNEILVVKTAPWVQKVSKNTVKNINSENKLEPFPTTYYLTSPKLTSAISRLEASGIMKKFQEMITPSSEIYVEDLYSEYMIAHKNYIKDREELAKQLELPSLLKTHHDFSAGGMPNRVKCLHALVGHELATRQNPIGKLVLKQLNIKYSETQKPSEDGAKNISNCLIWDISNVGETD